MTNRTGYAYEIFQVLNSSCTSFQSSFSANGSSASSVGLKSCNDFSTVFGGAVQVTVGRAFVVQPLANDRKHADKLAEDENAMAAVDYFFKQFTEELQLAGCRDRIDLFELQQAQIATN